MERGIITEVNIHEDGGATIAYGGWNINVRAEELIGFTPQVGQSIEVGPSVGFPIQYINIDGCVIRDISDEEQAQIREEMIAGFRRKKEEDFAEHGDEWKATVKTLLPVLRKRMERFEREEGDEFWIDMGAYELYAIKAADVLARKAMELHPEDYSAQIEWINWWDSLNSKTHDYDYKYQMEVLPEFGDGHSGNTYGAAVYYAKRAVQDQPC